MYWLQSLQTNANTDKCSRYTTKEIDIFKNCLRASSSLRGLLGMEEFPRLVVTELAWQSSRSILTMLSGTRCDSEMALCRARSWMLIVIVNLFQLSTSYDSMNLNPWINHRSMKCKVKLKFRDLKYRLANNNRVQTLSKLCSVSYCEKELSGLAHNCVLSLCLPIM